MAQNPFLHTMIQSGYYDGATKYFDAKYTMWRLDPSGRMKDRLSFKGYRSGHMMYLRSEDLKQANDDVGAAIRKHPDRIVGFAASSPSFGTNWVRDELKRCFEELGCTGMKVHNAYERLPMRDQSGTREYREALEATWEFADERACPVLCHGFLSPDVAGRYPRAKFIAAHACGQRGTADTYADYPNVYFDTACSGTGRGNVEYFAKRVGAERVLYGSDLPYANPAYRIGQVIGTRVGDDDLRKILGGNMARLLGLKHSYAGRPPFHRSDRSNSSHSRRAAGRKGRKL